jgi:hypothetical protein
MVAAVALVAAGIAAGPASALQQTTPPTGTLPTPDGATTVSAMNGGPFTMEGIAPQVLTGWKVGVGAGGQGGHVRIRVSTPLDPSQGTKVGPWVDLPATPGVYTFSAPHMHWDYREGSLAVDQQNGGHEIVTQETCQPGAAWDPCSLHVLGSFHGLADGGSAAVTPTVPADPADRVPGGGLAIVPITAPDYDGDRLPDADEHSKLDVTAKVVAPAASGARRVTFTATNVGSTAATMPLLYVSGNFGPGSELQPPVGTGAWDPACAPYPDLSWDVAWIGFRQSRPPTTAACLLAPIAAGASRSVTAEVGGWVSKLTVVGETETPNGAGSGRRATLHVPGADDDQYVDAFGSPCTTHVGTYQHLGRGIRLRLTAKAKGTAKVTARLSAGGRRTTLATKVRFRRAGTKTVVLRARPRARAALRAALKRHRGTIRVTTRFVPAKGDAATTIVKATLKR